MVVMVQCLMNGRGHVFDAGDSMGRRCSARSTFGVDSL
jgi:alpha-D-ribose 1-methylphosphonate 5-triphosphate synthase subunit PhnG